MNPSYREDDSSQIPALLLLQALGYQYLSPTEALQLRGGKTSGILLEEVLRQQIHRNNTFRYKDRSYAFSETNVSNAIYALQDYPLQEGFMASNKYLYDLLTLGKSFEETILGDRKSYTLHYIDWKNPANNVFHVTEELSVQRSHRPDGGGSHYRPDIVLYINGIPLVVIECKSPLIDRPLSQAISQHLRNQNEDGIRSLYVYSQLCIALCQNSAQYGTTATEEAFWGAWREQFTNRQAEEAQKTILQTLKNESINTAAYWEVLENKADRKKLTLSSGAGGQEVWHITSQDEHLYYLCRPERLFDLIFNFIVYDAGAKIIARYQQYFGVRKTLERLKISSPSLLVQGSMVRTGGVIWHTQGSGKSYTMVMLAQLLATEKTIPNPKIILVTDRVELDDQIYQTFAKCEKEVVQAKTGNDLIEYLSQSSDAIITTLINKFDAAVKKIPEAITTPNIFVLVDEGHRTQYGTLNVKMQRVLPTACFIAFTGTPLMKKEKNTAAKFGGIIDSYTVADAVADGAVVPLLFEGRAPLFNVNERPLDNYFNKISEPLNDYQRVDLKRKFSRQEALTAGEQVIYAKAWDISKHYKDNWQGTGFKGQLVAPNKQAAVRYKRFLDEIGLVSSEVLVSPPDDREGTEDAYGHISDEVLVHWKKMMDKYGTAKKYDETLRQAFKKSDTPEIIIVVDKLLTGFDNPRNVVLYLCRKLREHTLFQAITRVNRKCAGKEFGYIIDYDGVIEELNQTLQLYMSYEDYDNQDLEATVTDIKEEIVQLPQVYSVLWDTFKTLVNKKDVTSYEDFLADEAVRTIFFERLSRFARLLKIALSSYQFVTQTLESEQKKYKDDLAFFQNLRKTVIQIYSLEIDYKQFEGQIQKLIDTHVSADEVVSITEQVNIFDSEKFEAEVQKIAGTASKAHAIASRTQKTITEKMDEDPAFYKRFSEMIKDTLDAYRQQRINEIEFLSKVTDIKEAVLNRQADDLPDLLQGRDTAQAIYRLLAEKGIENLSGQTALLSLLIEDKIKDNVLSGGAIIVDWQNKSEVIGKLKTAFDDSLWEFKNDYGLAWDIATLDDLIEKFVSIAKVRFNGKS
ncbi:type I restriction endonuclease subunit R [Runella zeae]|uniref:type I restriction endonuclease subunit R n=1 Tax=Runella zeae TaxID=94255 RepID=UPI000490C6FB|nr:HsdR family type I site-specific deoxyribonuclease [Runella zeae]